jgi:hypothetical protein
MAADVDYLHVKRIHLVSFSYIIIEDKNSTRNKVGSRAYEICLIYNNKASKNKSDVVNYRLRVI